MRLSSWRASKLEVLFQKPDEGIESHGNVRIHLFCFFPVRNNCCCFERPGGKAPTVNPLLNQSAKAALDINNVLIALFESLTNTENRLCVFFKCIWNRGLFLLVYEHYDIMIMQ